jgi:hypothetical protein
VLGRQNTRERLILRLRGRGLGLFRGLLLRHLGRQLTIVEKELGRTDSYCHIIYLTRSVGRGAAVFPVKGPLVPCLLLRENYSTLLHLGSQPLDLGWLVACHKTMRKHYPARGKCLNCEAGMRRVTVGNARRKGQEDVGSLSVSGREAVARWLPSSYLGGYPSLVQSINIC